jgi:NTP pyrophosphatase (non-canonical NTP hydrolase)
MNLNEYQQQIVSLWENNKEPDELLLFCCCGMEEEAGEAQGKVKRWMRGEGFSQVDYLKELGDVLAYFVVAAHAWDKDIKLNVTNQNCKYMVSPKTLFYYTHDLVKQIALFTDEVIAGTESTTDFQNVLGRLSWCALNTESDLQEVMQFNLDKLTDRIARNGTVRGSGDNR